MQTSRNYIVLPSGIRKVGCAPYRLNRTRRDPYNDKRVKYYDQKLCQTLIKIFHEHRLSSVEIKKLINTPEKLSDNNSIFKMIWRRERVLRKLLLKRTKLSLLWIVVVSNYQDSAELLVSSGADVNELYGLLSSSHGLTKKSTVLHALLRTYPFAWNEQFIDMVMNHGADVNAREPDRHSVLHRDIQNGRVKAVKMLLERRAEDNTTRFAGKTPLLDAARTNEADELLPLLMSYVADINVTDIHGFNILRCLTLCPDKEHVDLTRLLIEKGVSSREVLVGVYESIHCAAKRGRIDLVNLLLDHGANVNALGLNNESPLYFVACERENPARLSILLKGGANIDLKTNFGETALHALVKHRGFRRDDKSTLEKLQILLKFSADVFAKDNEDSTILDVICRQNLHNLGLVLIIKTLALKADSSTASKLTQERYTKLFDFYQDCVEEIEMARSTKFIENCMIFELLAKRQCEVAALMRHREFERRFVMFNLSYFAIYFTDIIEAFECTKKHYQYTMDRENLVEDVTDNIFPYMIVRKIVGYAVTECSNIVRVWKSTFAPRCSPCFL
ncbi:hypothetical protein TSAR_015784 [Trichomalopsis sarcophagae]|uniref:Uncharacterized protein n=1 Tax=Trichomalopsis sarcophagae TaxID=543379 RepID=A0A232EUE6_9HYME|nr:hypothetical protein TSAR_015784 [Trichomalopsis sarcophagae]